MGAQRPAANPPNSPGTACTGPTPQGSSIFSFRSIQRAVNGICAPATTPISTANSGCTRCTPEQIATAPARPPFGVTIGSGLSVAQVQINEPTIPPAIAASVLIATNGRSAAMFPYDGTEPRLKPNQQNINNSAPVPIMGTSCAFDRVCLRPR